MKSQRKWILFEVGQLGILVALAVMRALEDGVRDFLFFGLVAVSILRVSSLTQWPRFLWRPRAGAASLPQSRR